MIKPIHVMSLFGRLGFKLIKLSVTMDGEMDRYGQAYHNASHHLPNDEHIFILGDCASLPHAPSAQLAEGQAEQIVEVLKKRWNG